MNQSRITFFALSSVTVIALLAGGLLGVAAIGDEGEEEDSLFKHLSVFTEVLGLIRQAYVDEANVDALMAGALDGTTDALDPFSLYVPAEEIEPYMAAREATRAVGVTLLKERGVAFVVAVVPGSPAEKAGIHVSDLVAEIGGRSTRTMPLWEVEEMLAVPAGTRLQLELLRLGETIETTLEVEPYDTPAVRFEETTDPEPAGVVRITRFGAETLDGVRSALEQAAAGGHDRVLIDLRGVAGGESAVAFRVAELFTRGELGSLQRKGEVVESFRGEAEPVWNGPLVVLVSRGTLGAAEVFATVLRQKLGAELVGERTFGWAGRRDSAPLGTGGRLFFTDAFYAGPDGKPLMSGLVPDVEVDSGRRFRDRDRPVGDLILERGVERLREKSAEATQQRAA